MKIKENKEKKFIKLEKKVYEKLGCKEGSFKPFSG